MYKFAPPKPLSLSKTERKDIAASIIELYEAQIQARSTGFNEQHLTYDAMFRGKPGGRQGPWDDASNTHVQAPYWGADAINTRLISAVWGQTPQVSGTAEREEDQAIFANATKLVDWHLQPKRMNARRGWAAMSRTRCNHGFAVGLLSYVENENVFRTSVPKDGKIGVELGDNGEILFDEDGIRMKEDGDDVLQRHTNYHGPILDPKSWDDLVVPEEVSNLQPQSPRNPRGADYVGLRGFAPVSLIWKKREGSYTYIDEADEASDREWWVAGSPAQDRSGPGGQNASRSRQQDEAEGRNRQGRSPRSKRAAPNPEIEVLTWFMPYEVDSIDKEGNSIKEELECVFFVSVHPMKLLGAFLLTDISWTGERPLVELHYQMVDDRFYSMGPIEIVQYLSDELDTIHNLRMDVGFATNMPYFFFRASSTVRPEKIKLKPLKGVPVDDVNDVRFPPTQNVTSFYHQEEQLLYTLFERVLGVTDLFLGISPTQGAAARHATGFVGAPQESLARPSEIVEQDAEDFSFMCRMIYILELQFGPEYRWLRLEGAEGPATQKLTRLELWMRGNFDFRLGANHGQYSSMMRQQQAQVLAQLEASSVLMNADQGRLWESQKTRLEAAGFPNPELYIGPKSSVAAGTPKSPEQENGDMDQSLYGEGQPANINPSDNTEDHILKHQAHVNSDAYASMNRPNLAGHLAHINKHMEAQAAQMAQTQAGVNASIGAQPEPPQQPGPMGQQDRMVPQLAGRENVGAMGDMSALTAGNGAPPPRLPQ